MHLILCRLVPACLLVLAEPAEPPQQRSARLPRDLTATAGPRVSMSSFPWVGIKKLGFGNRICNLSFEGNSVRRAPVSDAVCLNLVRGE